MIEKTNVSCITLLFILSFYACENDQIAQQETDFTTEEKTLFRLLSSETTQIKFSNTLEEGLNTNILMYEYFYNGGGVAAADFNDDDLVDLYFTSNMGDNKLYLNQGDMKFKDVTQISGAAGRKGPWKTGISAADVNGDGKIDLYLSYSGALPDPKRKNQLFINLGKDENNIPKFEDQAEKYGVASTAFSNQAYFLDFDKDGDLDMLLLNHNPKNLPILNEVQTAELFKVDDPAKGIRLLMQDKGTFKDITQSAGISSSPLTYGLGIGIGDFNKDGWSDFYVSNDYAVPDYLYINNKNGTFKNTIEESIGHTSQFSMGNDVADLNNDGWQDIISLDMLPEDNERQKLLVAPDNYAKFDHNVRSGFYYQYMRNMLQLNNGNGTFSEVGQFAGISNTDWSWAALAADYDNDGWKDLYVTNGYNRDYTNLDFINYMDDFVKQKGRLQREDVLEIINNMPASDVKNYIYKGSESLKFNEKTKAWGLDQVANSNGATYADLDNDGDLDLIVNNINKEAFVYENLANENTAYRYLQVELEGEGLNTQGQGTKVSVYCGESLYFLEQFSARAYLSSVSSVLHFGLGKHEKIDSLIVEWNSGKIEKQYDLTTNQRLTFYEKEAKKAKGKETKIAAIFKEVSSPIDYENKKWDRRDFDRQALLISELSQASPAMLKADFNGDGLEDVFIGGGVGQSASLYFQSSQKQFKISRNTVFEQDQASEDTDAVLIDANKDGFQDIYVTSGGYHLFQPNDPLLQDRLYLNDGKGNFTKSENALPTLYSSTSCAAVTDINKDGFQDVFVGGRVVPGRYPENPRSYILLNNGNGEFRDGTKEIAADLAEYGMICDAVWIDLNKDEQEDLVVIGEWLPISVFLNEGGKLSNRTADFFEETYKGFWNNIAIADFNKDGKMDFVLGNIGTNIQFQASQKETVQLLFKDFDDNGSVDPLFASYVGGELYPYVTRDELLKQVVSYRSVFRTYESYSNTKVNDLFTSKELSKINKLEANRLESSLFLSTPNGKYTLSSLPKEVQYSAIYSTLILDYNNDGNEDLLLCGNNSHLKLRLGKMDANYGILLKGDGTGKFQYINQAASGLNIRGDVRSAVQIGNLFLFGRNEDTLLAYEF